jgi:hypothetical protein
MHNKCFDDSLAIAKTITKQSRSRQAEKRKKSAMAKDSELLKWGLGVSWLTSWFLIIPISIIAIIVTIFKLTKRKSKLAKYAVILSPFLILPILNIGMAIIDYSQGEAKLKLIGYPAPEFANINQEYRTENYSLGCTFTGTEYLTSFRYNQTVKFLINNLGYQKNSYAGIMPTKEEAKELLSNVEYEIGKIEFEGDEKIRIANNSKTCEIDLSEQHGLIRMTIKESEINPNPKLKIIDNCLISQLNNDWIYLIDMKRNKVIAEYRI